MVYYNYVDAHVCIFKKEVSMIIGLSGYMQSGKDTAGKMIQEMVGMKVGTMFVSYFNIKKFATKLKKIAGIMLGVDASKFEDQDYKESYLPPEWGKMTVRQFLQNLGTKAIRHHVHEDAWVIATMADYKPDGPGWIMTDCRFPNEAQAIKDRGGIIIRINREVPGVSQKFIDRSESEVSLDDWKFDYVVNNLGSLDDLRNQIKEILRQIKLL